MTRLSSISHHALTSFQPVTSKRNGVASGGGLKKLLASPGRSRSSHVVAMAYVSHDGVAGGGFAPPAGERRRANQGRRTKGEAFGRFPSPSALGSRAELPTGESFPPYRR